MRTRTLIRAVPGVFLFAALLLPLRVGAQDDSRWLPWLGCWEPIDPETGATLPGSVLVCLQSAGASAVDVVTFTGGEPASRRIVANGAQREVREADCTGWERAAWSADARRVYVHSELTCEGGTRRTLSGVMAFVSPTEWVDAQSIGLGTDRAPRLQRFRLVDDARARAAGFEPGPAERSRLGASMRSVVSAPLSIDDVREAATLVDGEALAALLVEYGEGFDLNAARLEALADEGVPTDVIDMMVALSYPETFRVDRAAREGEFRSGEERERYGAYAGEDPYWRRRNPFGWYGGFGYGYGYCNPYSFDYWYGYCRTSRYGIYDPYGWSYFGGRPVIIIRGTDEGSRDAGGRAVNGRGYTRSRSSSDERSAARRGESSGSSGVGTARAGTSSGGGSVTRAGHVGGSSAGSARSGGSSSGTAKRRGGG